MSRSFVDEKLAFTKGDEINELTLYQITLEDQQFYRYAHAFAVKAVSLVRVDRDTFMNNYTQHQ